MSPETHEFMWRGIEIKLVYTPLKWGVMDHLEIQSLNPKRAPLPITPTGYKSRFQQPGVMEAHGGDVVAQLIAWLDDEAAKPKWREFTEAARQGTLF